ERQVGDDLALQRRVLRERLVVALVRGPRAEREGARELGAYGAAARRLSAPVSADAGHDGRLATGGGRGVRDRGRRWDVECLLDGRLRRDHRGGRGGGRCDGD